MKLSQYIHKRVDRQEEIADACGVIPGAVRHWANGTRTIPPEQCPNVEKASTGLVTCEELRNDLAWERDGRGGISYRVVVVKPGARNARRAEARAT